MLESASSTQFLNVAVDGLSHGLRHANEHTLSIFQMSGSKLACVT